MKQYKASRPMDETYEDQKRKIRIFFRVLKVIESPSPSNTPTHAKEILFARQIAQDEALKPI